MSRTGPVGPASTSRTTWALLSGSPPTRSARPARGTSELQRVQLGPLDLAVGVDPHGRRGGRGQLVQAVAAVHHQPLVAPGGEHPRHQLRHPRVGDADRLTRPAAPGWPAGRGS